MLPDIRTGNGYDVHRLVPERPLVLCGVTIPHTLGLKGHSDADVATHALIDAILGAACLGDIGAHFPDTDPKYAGIDSQILLRHTLRAIAAAGYALRHFDITIVAQQPKLRPHIDDMRHALAATTGLPLGRISVKATTTEHLGFTGRAEGIAALATATIAATPS